MSLDSVLSSGRRAAESRMLDRATVRRLADGTAQDEATGLVTQTWQVVYADRPCRISGAARGSSTYRTVASGGVDVETAARIAHFAHDTVLIDGDYIEVTSGEHVGIWRVIEADPADQQTALRVPVIAARRPEGWS